MNSAEAIRAYESFFTNSFDATLVLDRNCVLERVNAAAVRLLGYPPEELVGKSLLEFLPPEVSGSHDSYVLAYLEHSGASKVLGKQRRFDLIHRSGERIPIELKAFELNQRSDPARFGAVIVDLRERLMLEEERDRSLKQLALLAHTDELTGLPNRRAFFDTLYRWKASIKRHGSRACIAVLDLDHFKIVNDTFGHDAGDDVLRRTARLIENLVRDTDLVGRIGGEEFGLLLHHNSISDAKIAVERIREAMEASVINVGQSNSLHVTASIGIAQITAEFSAEADLKRADLALYRAKEMGRNRVEVYASDPNATTKTMN